MSILLKPRSLTANSNFWHTFSLPDLPNCAKLQAPPYDKKEPPVNDTLTQRQSLCQVQERKRSFARVRLLGSQFKISRPNRLQHLHDAGPNFTGFRMAAHFLLRKDQLAVDPDVKYSTGGGNHFPAADEILDFAFVQDFVRQTDGIRLVSSSRAILDDNIRSSFLHDCVLSHRNTCR